MSSKYAKIFCAFVAILLLSVFQYQELYAFYKDALPYVAVKEYQQHHKSQQGPVLIDRSKLVGSNLKKEHSYQSSDLAVLAEDENEVAITKGVNDPECEEAFVKLQEKPQFAMKLKAVGSVLMDGDSQRVLYGKNEDQRLAMASTTKIMTCLVALENGNLDDVVTASKNAQKMPDVQLNMMEGEQYYLKDLLYSLMLESHNDSAVAIAEHIGGSLEGFAAMMNQKAKELGCVNTNFVTPNGLDAPEHYTTPRELGIITSAAIKNPMFVEITNTPTYEFTEITKEKKHLVNNKNRFLYMMDGAIGVKTGFTNQAGYCFVGAVKRDDRTFISVVLGSGWPPHKTYKWNDTMLLMNYGVQNFFKDTLINHRVVLDQAYIQNGQESSCMLYTEGDLTTLIGKDEVVTVEYLGPKILKAPIKQGKKVGELDFKIDGTKIASLPVYTDHSIKKLNLSFCLRKLMQGFLIH